MTFYLEKSDLVVEGQIVSAPWGVTSELGVVRYGFEFQVAEVYKGDPKLKGQKFPVSIKRFVFEEGDKHPLIEKNAKCVLFLKTSKGKPSWREADMWFAIQHPNKMLGRALQRLSL